MKGHNQCSWLKVGELDIYGKSCCRMFCKVHLAKLRKGRPVPVPCKSCGKGGSERDTSLQEVRERKGSPAPYRVGEENQNTVRFGARSAYCGTNSYLDIKLQ